MKFYCIQKCPHFRGKFTVYRCVLISEEEFHCNKGIFISRGWNRGVPLYTEVSSFQGVGIDGFHCIKKCPHF